MPSGLFYLKSLKWSIFNIRGVCWFVLLPCFIEISVLNAESVDPDQTSHSAASDLGLHYLPMNTPFMGRQTQMG